MMDENEAARDQMAWVSLSGGLALANAGLGAVHGLAGVIGGRTGAAHGAICGALLPHVLRANAVAVGADGQVAKRFEQVFGWISEVFGSLDGLESWAHGEGLPRLSVQGIAPHDHAEIAAASLGASSMKANPVALGQAELQAILATAG
jgi:alcohol dehydrogenase class IV